MNDAELEKLAIAELMQEAKIHSLNIPRLEPKQNKLVKPNKKFLSNTLISALSHNKRVNERTQRQCLQKLNKLEQRRCERLDKYKQQMKEMEKSSSSSYEAIDSSSNDSVRCLNSQDKLSRKRQNDKDGKSYVKKKKAIKKVIASGAYADTAATTVNGLDTQRLQYEREEYYAKYFDQLAAVALASESYNQVGKWLCYQALLAGSYESYEQNNDLTYECMTLKGSNVLGLLNQSLTIKENVISLSSDDEINEELDLDSYIEDVKSPSVLFQAADLLDKCITIDTDLDEEPRSSTLSENALEFQLLDNELYHSDGESMQTIVLSDSSDDDEPVTILDANDSIDLTSD